MMLWDMVGKFVVRLYNACYVAISDSVLQVRREDAEKSQAGFVNVSGVA
jgi:hypothetical protein